MDVPYELKRSRRTSVGIRVNEKGGVIVYAPQRMPKEELDRIVSRKADWIGKTRKKVLARAAAHPEPTDEQRREYIRRARAEIPLLAETYAPVVGVRPAGITITSAKTRFGSCSAKNRLSFSWRLMQYPREAIEYVVVHELCHIKQHNHSPAFYAELARVLPDHKERRKLLRL